MPIERVLNGLCLVPRLSKRIRLSFSVLTAFGMTRDDIAAKIGQKHAAAEKRPDGVLRLCGSHAPILSPAPKATAIVHLVWKQHQILKQNIRQLRLGSNK